MKLSFEQKIEIYNKWKLDGHSFHSLAHEYKVNYADIQYLLRLADRHGIETLRHKWTYDSPAFKKEAILKVLKNHESPIDVSIDLSLSNRGMLSRWATEFIQNDYTVVEKKKGHASHAKQAGTNHQRTQKGNKELRRQNEILWIQNEYVKN